MKNVLVFSLIVSLGCLASCGKTPTADPPANEVVSSFLSYPNVTSMAEDVTGHIWIGTSYGLNRAMPYGYHQYFADTDSLCLQNNHVTALYSDRSGRLWIAGKDGNLCYLTEKGQFRPVSIGYHEKVRVSFVEMPSGELLCNDENGIFRYDPEKEAMLALVDGPQKNLGFFPSGDRLLVAYPDGLRFYDPADGSLLSEHPLPEGCQGVSQAPDGNLWISTTEGRLEIIRPETMAYQPVPRQLADALRGKRIQQLVREREDSGALLINLGDDILHYTAKTGQVHTLREKGFSVDTQMFNINCVLYDSQDNIWIGTDGGGLRILHNFHTWTRFQILLEYFKGTPISAISYENNTIFITDHRNRIYQFDLSEKAVKPLPAGKRDQDRAAFPRRSLHLSDGGVLTVNDNSHIIVSMPDSDLGYIISEEKVLEALHAGQFHPTALFQDSRGQVWIGTKSNGLVVLNLQANEVRGIPGIVGKDVSSILEDLDGNIWVATKNGLYEYALDGTLMNNFSRNGQEGENAYMDNSYCLLPDGILLLGTMRGINIVNPRKEQRAGEGRFYLEDLRVHNSIVRPGKDAPIDKAMIYSPPIRLRHDQNNFGILFTELNYGKPNDGSYSYMLEGFNEFWINCGNSHEAFFSNVPPGHYVFKARISDANGLPFGSAVCEVTIRPAPWASPLARLLYVLLGVGLLSAVLILSLRHAKNKESIRRMEMEKQQEQHMNDIIKKYFANVAHQLRTPLTMIHGPIETLYVSPSLGDADRNLIRILRNNARRMLGLVNQIMNLHSLESDALSMKVSRSDITPVLEKTLDLYRVNAGEKRIRLVTEGLDRDVIVYADTEKIVNILDNLLSNAFKFTPEGGEVLLSLRQDGGWAELTVKNSGPTIPEDKLEAIFRRFYQVDSSSKGKVNWGSGIGLYYARRLAGLHHGTLVCRNEENGDGVRFILRFPIDKESFTPEELSEGPADPVKTDDVSAPVLPAGAPLDDASGILKPTVLVIDDDLDISLYLKTVLGSVFNVRSCYDAESALRVLEDVSPDLIVSDIMMSGMSGLDLCARLKDDLQYCHIPVILLTAKDRMEDQIAGLRTGADAYVTKPFHAEYLLSLAENLVAGRKRLQRYLSENAGLAQENSLSAQDRTFLEQLYAIWEEHLSDTEFNISSVVDQLHVSHTKFIYKVKGLTGFTPSELFMNYKLNKAAAMLREGRYNVSEVADLTGFGTLAHFSRAFKKKFGVPPSEYKG